MQYAKHIWTGILILSIAMSFAFSAVAAAPESEWDGVSVMGNNKSYLLSSSAEISGVVIIPADTTLTVMDGGEINIAEDGVLLINGGLNTGEGCPINSRGRLIVAESGTLSVFGDLTCEENSVTEISGLTQIQPLSNVKLCSETILSETGAVICGGNIFIEKNASLSQTGKLYLSDNSEFIIRGAYELKDKGLLDSLGGIAVMRRGSFSVNGEMYLHENSSYSPAGKVEISENAVVTDLSIHADFKMYTPLVLEQEEETVLRGIDVSWVQGDIDWDKAAKSGIDFAIIRAGRGDIDGEGPKTDTHFYRNITGALRNNLQVGVYFYSYAETIEDAEREAEYLLEIIKNYEISFPVILDMEEIPADSANVSELIDAFLGTVADAGYFPMIYSYKFWFEYHIDDEITDKYAAWVAQIGDDEPETDFDYYIWQYTHDGKVNGIEGAVDYNIAYRDFRSIFEKYGLNGL